MLLLDTDALPAPETRAGEATTNATEAALALQVVQALIAGRVGTDEIGIISPYRSQARAPELVPLPCHGAFKHPLPAQ